MSEVHEAPENCQSEPGLNPSPQEGMKVLQTEVLHPATPTDGTVGQKKVSSRNWSSAKPTYMALLFLLLVPTVNFNPIPARKCALCLHPQCATRILRICKGDEFIWPKEMLGIKNCSMDNLKPDEPCQLMNGSLVLQSDQLITFEGMEHFPSKTVFCADLDLSPGPKSPLGQSMNTTPRTTTPDTGPYRAAILWSVGGVVITVIIAVIIGIIVWKYGKRFKRSCRRLDGTGPQNAAPPDGNAGNEYEMSPLQGQANGNVTQGPGNVGGHGVRFPLSSSLPTSENGGFSGGGTIVSFTACPTSLAPTLISTSTSDNELLHNFNSKITKAINTIAP